jgi:hypothetical protein
LSFANIVRRKEILKAMFYTFCYTFILKLFQNSNFVTLLR